MGGTLYEHILDQHAGSLQHQYYPDWPRDYLAHDVKIDGDSRLGRLLTRTDFKVNSLHHQGVKRLAPDLRASAYAPDGIVEALELPDYPFGLAVQWHPESLPNEKETRMLFSAFVEACKPTLD
jgi:putative glutamine amidotransferase